jgi:hypothetical protein
MRRQAFGPQLPLKGFDESVVGRLARPREVERGAARVDTVLLRPKGTPNSASIAGFRAALLTLATVSLTFGLAERRPAPRAA